MEKLKVFIYLTIIIVGVQCTNCNQEPNEPLILSPYIKNCQFAKAKELAAVKYPDLVSKGVKSYSGFLTVNKTCNSNLFFWFFLAKVNSSKAPVVLYLNGGPGQSSLYGALMENGPVYIHSNNTLQLRKYSWHEKHNLLYIDSPVGTGFSFTNSLDCYLTNEVDIGRSLYEALRQFFQLFSELRKNSFYITGESYAGKYVPALGHQILLNRNSCKPNDCINFKGLAIGDGIIDPINQLDYGSLLFQLGFIDANALAIFVEYQQQAKLLIEQGQYLAALLAMTNIINWDGCLFNNETGFSSPHNYLKPDGYANEISQTTEFISNQSNLSKYLHVGNVTFVSLYDSGTVLTYLIDDITQSVSHWLIELLECDDIRVFIYSGQYDVLAGPVLQGNFLSHLEFSGAGEYAIAERQIWRIGDTIAGYVKKAGSLTEIIVRLAGHMVPIDQPKSAYDIILKLTGDGF